VPRLKAAERERRDALVFQMFLSGISYRAIGKHERVQLSCRGVDLAVKRQLAASAQRRAVLTDEAVSVHTERLESLFAAAYGDALRGNHRAGEQARRLLDSIGRLHGLVSGAERPPAEPPLADDPEVDEDGMDELQRYRFGRYGTID
jgi:hypothetical protein